MFSYRILFHLLWPETFFQAITSHTDLFYWSGPSDLKKKNSSERRTKQFVLLSVLFSSPAAYQLLVGKADQSPVVAALPVCVFERAGLYWERPSNSWMYRPVRSPPCCRPPGSAAPPSPSWELKVTGGRKRGFRIKMVNMSRLSKV